MFAVTCKRFRLILKGFSLLSGISRQYQRLGESLNCSLQNRVLRFNSGRGLHIKLLIYKDISSHAVPFGIHDPYPEMAAGIMAYFQKIGPVKAAARIANRRCFRLSSPERR